MSEIQRLEAIAKVMRTHGLCLVKIGAGATAIEVSAFPPTMGVAPPVREEDPPEPMTEEQRVRAELIQWWKDNYPHLEVNHAEIEQRLQKRLRVSNAG